MAEPRPWLCNCHQQRALWMWTTGEVRCAVTSAVLARMPRHTAPPDGAVEPAR